MPITLIVDSVNELLTISNLQSKSNPFKARIGIRVVSKLCFQKNTSRFGIDIDDPKQLKVVRDAVASGVNIKGIHLHITEDRSVESFEERLDYLIRVWDELNIGDLQFVDVGGGFASNMPAEIRKQLTYSVSTLKEYGNSLGKKMKQKFHDEEVELICEPGTGILAE